MQAFHSSHSSVFLRKLTPFTASTTSPARWLSPYISFVLTSFLSPTPKCPTTCWKFVCSCPKSVVNSICSKVKESKMIPTSLCLLLPFQFFCSFMRKIYCKLCYPHSALSYCYHCPLSFPGLKISPSSFAISGACFPGSELSNH